MLKNLLIGGTALAVALAMPVLAQARITTQANTHISTQGSLNTNGPAARDRDFGAARAEDRMSTQGSLNTNGPNAKDRDFGQARAEDRMSANALKHKTKVHAKVDLDIKDKDDRRE